MMRCGGGAAKSCVSWQDPFDFTWSSDSKP